jgi:hypothetical protein
MVFLIIFLLDDRSIRIRRVTLTNVSGWPKNIGSQHWVQVTKVSFLTFYNCCIQSVFIQFVRLYRCHLVSVANQHRSDADSDTAATF